MKSMISLAYFLVLSCCCFISLTFSYDCNGQDKEALLKIKEAFGNPNGLSSWNASNDCCHDFEGVDCLFRYSPSNRVHNLFIEGVNLSGQIPPEIGDLTYLDRIHLTGLNVTGPIQPAIKKLKHLTELTLRGLQLTGSVPSFLGQLKNLSTLDLSNNYLSGSIPSSLSDLTSLGELKLPGNKLTGTIPDSFGTFTITIIDLSNNQLSGKIPNSLEKMSFSGIDLSGNKLEGDASMLFTSKSNNTASCYEVILWGNLLEFDLSKVRISDEVSVLNLRDNKIYGNIPSQMTQLYGLYFLDLSYNRLCGQIPQGGRLQTFDKDSYLHNRCLCGAPLDVCK